MDLKADKKTNYKDKDLHGGSNMNSFFRTPTKLAFLVLLAGWLIFSVASVPSMSAQDDSQKVLLTLDKGAVQFYKEIGPSIVQVFNGGIYTQGMGGGGSGYVFDREGHLITNRHVTESSPNFEIMFIGDQEETRSVTGSRYKGTLIAEDPTIDLAVIKVDAPPEKFNPIHLADSAKMKAGDIVATFGSPGGDPYAVNRSRIAWQENWLDYFNLNQGVVAEVLDFEQAFWTFQGSAVSFLQEKSGIRDYGSCVQYLFHVDSAINQGNSGGPCLNQYGEAIGTNTWGGGGENMGFSVPVNLLKRSATDIIQYGRPRHPWMGIALNPRFKVLKQYLLPEYGDIVGAPENKSWFNAEPGALKIYTVNPYSPAYKAGLREGDILLSLDGKAFKNVFDVYKYFLNADIGQKVRVEYERNGHSMPAIVVTLDEKRTRYFGNEVYVEGSSWGVGDLSWYTSDLTY
jgi:serine protease Do